MFGITKTISIKITSKKEIYDNKIFISIPHMKKEIPIFILFKALGCITEKEMIYYIIDNNNYADNGYKDLNQVPKDQMLCGVCYEENEDE